MAEKAAIEAIVFAAGEPIATRDIALAVDCDEETAVATLEAIAREYTERGSGIELLRLGDMWQFATRADYADAVRAAIISKKSAPLSSAAMEVLTVTAYNQPVSRAFIDHVRGVDSSSVLNGLIDKELIEEAGRMDIPGRPLAYQVTPHFLRCFGLASLDELPSIPEMEEEKTVGENSADGEE